MEKDGKKGEATPSNLLDHDIEARFEKEQKSIVKPPKKKPSGRGSQILMAFLLAIIVLIGLIVPLFTLF